MVIQLGPKWLTLFAGFRILVKPISERMRTNASQAYRAARDAFLDGRVLEEGERDIDAERAGDDAYNRSLAVDGIIDWAGEILDPDGNPAAVTPEHINMLLDYAPAFQAFDEQYLAPFMQDLQSKNVFSPFFAGPTSQGEAKNTAAPVKSPTAPSGAAASAPS